MNWKPNSVILLCAGMKWGKKNHKTEEAAWRRRRACADRAEEAAINKDHTIYVHFLSTALWKHITWRRDLLDLVLSQHPEHETTFTDLQGRRCCSLPATASHLTIIGRAVVEKVLLVIEFSLREKEKIRINPRRRRGPTGAQRSFVRYTEERAPWQQEKTPSGLMRQKSVFVDERLRGREPASHEKYDSRQQVLPFISLCEDPQIAPLITTFFCEMFRCTQTFCLILYFMKRVHQMTQHFFPL